MPDSAPLTLSRVTYWWFCLAVFLLPFLIIPGLSLPLELPKRFFFAGAVVVTLVLYLLVGIERGRFVVPKHSFLVGGSAVLIAFFLAAVFSPPRLVSFSGLALEQWTFLALLFFIAAMFLAAALLNSEKKILSFYTATLVSFLVLFLFQVSYWSWPAVGRLFGLESGADNLLGKWHDFAVFAGFIVVLSLILLQFRNLPVKRAVRVLAVLSLITALAMLILVDFTAVWWTVAGVSLLASLLTFSLERSKRGWVGVAVLALAVFMVTVGNFLPIKTSLGRLEQRLGLASLEIRPSPRVTFSIAREALRENPFFGAGPNKFNVAWSRFRPGTEINNTPFWDTDFSSGFSWLLTFLVNGGLVSSAALLLLLFFLLWPVRRVFYRGLADSPAAALVLASALPFLYLWTATTFYVSETVVLVFTFLISGVLASALMQFGKTQSFIFGLPGSLCGVVVRLASAVVLVVLAGFSVYGLSAQFFSRQYYSKSLKAWEKEREPAAAEGLLRQASKLAQHDLFYLSLAEIQLAKIAKTADPETLRALVQEAVASARQAVNLNPLNYRNWLGLAKVYAALVTLGVSGAAEEASAALRQAQILNPHHPQADLELAKLELERGSPEQAREHLILALEKKADFIPAVSLLAQLERTREASSQAITRLVEAARLQPGDFGLWFELGYFLYETQQFERAADAFSKALELRPNHSDSLYFLGLSYAGLGRLIEAAAEFKKLQLLNPGRSDLERIITELEGGLWSKDF